MSMAGMIDLEGKCAVVTGGSRGVGRAAALLLARAGCAVGISYRSRDHDADEVVREVQALGVPAWSERGDLSDPEAVDRLFARADAEFEGLDILVGNHGIWPPEDVALQDMDPGRWQRTLRVNLDSMFHVVSGALARMRRGGRVVLVSSTAAQRGEAFHADYAASKGALVSMVKGLCVETGARDITVNAVAPGWILTEMSESAFQDGGGERIAQGIPLGRIATAEDVAGPILFLCSDLARHVTGEVLNVNGGAVFPG